MSGKTVTVSSGKGGVGKTFFAANFGMELAYKGYKVCIFDVDINFSNIFILFNIKPQNLFQQYFENKISLKDAAIPTKYKNVDIISAGVNILKFFDFSDRENNSKLIQDLNELKEMYDFIIIDCGAGVTDNMLDIFKMADEAVLVCNHEITSLTDLYRIIKLIAVNHASERINLLINKVRNIDYAVNLFREINKVIKRFNLNVELFMLGPVVNNEKEVVESIQKRIPYVELFPKSAIKGGIALSVQRFLFKIGETSGRDQEEASMIDIF